MGITAQYFGGDGWDGIQTNFGAVAEGAIFASQFSPEDKAEKCSEIYERLPSKNLIKNQLMFAALWITTQWKL